MEVTEGTAESGYNYVKTGAGLLTKNREDGF